MTTRAGCNVRDDGRMCPNSLFYDEHRLVDGALLHPVGLDDNGRWRFDEDTTERDDR